jgi:hypothetical protein
MNITRVLEFVLANRPPALEVALAAIFAIAIAPLTQFLIVRRRRKIETLKQLEEWSRVGAQRRFFEDLRNRPDAKLPLEAKDQMGHALEPGKLRVGEGSMVSKLLLILNSEQPAPRAPSPATVPTARRAASR